MTTIETHLREAARVLSDVASSPETLAHVQSVADALFKTLRGGGTVYVIGNGGSAAMASHFAAEFIVRLNKDDDRRPYPVVALTTDTAVLTACANDLGYEQVFARQLRALLRKGDAVLALSTSGNSVNLWRSLHWGALHEGFGTDAVEVTACLLVGAVNPASMILTYARGHYAVTPSTDPARIQEAHLAMLHAIAADVLKRLGES